MNYFMKCQLLSEGFKHEQIIEEDWEDLKKELTNLYVAGKITERQISTRLARAGMGSLSKNAAYKIAHDPENAQKREAVFSKAKKEEEEKAKREAIAAQTARHQVRGSAAANYNSQERINAWLKAVKEYNEKHGIKEDVSLEEVKYIMENNMDNEELRCLLEDTAQYLLENGGPKKFVKGLKKAALGVAAAGALAAAPGVVSGVKNVKRQADYRAMDKAGSAYNYQMKQDEINAKQNEIAQRVHDTGVEFKDKTKEAAKAVGNAAQNHYKKSIPAVKNFANKSKEELEELYKKGKISLEEYRAAKEVAKTSKKAASALKEAVDETVKEEVSYFNY